jgi:hypothetical protein
MFMTPGLALFYGGADRLVGLRLTSEEEDGGLDLSQHREVAYTWTERSGFPAHMVTVPDTAPAPAISLSPLEIDLLGDPALD